MLKRVNIVALGSFFLAIDDASKVAKLILYKKIIKIIQLLLVFDFEK
jgi:hypothetical protein